MNSYSAFGWYVSEVVCDGSGCFVLPFGHENVWKYLIMEGCLSVVSVVCCQVEVSATS